MKILILFQKGLAKKYRNWIAEDNTQLFEKDWVKNKFIDEPIVFSYEEQSVDIPFVYLYLGKQAEGRGHYGTSAYNLVNELDTEGYDYVYFVYQNTFKTSGTDYVAPLTIYPKLKSGAYFMEIPHDFYTRSYHTPAHELMHAIAMNLSDRGFIPRGISDNMDVTLVNGKLTTYYHNSDPLFVDGNYHRTLQHLRPYLQYLGTDDTKATLLTSIKNKIAELQKKLEQKTASKWKYFSPNEKTGSQGVIADLNPKLVDMLDEAREKAGIPFVITSGKRTKEHNKAVGGVVDSEHLFGNAVDIRAISGQDKLKIVKGLLEAGFTRVGISWKGNFVHADISESKADTLYTY